MKNFLDPKCLILTKLISKSKLIKSSLWPSIYIAVGYFGNTLKVNQSATLIFFKLPERNPIVPNSHNLDPTHPLSPSELVLLNGEQFAKKVMLGNFQLLHTDAGVSYSQLGEAMLTAGVLAVESIGNLQLEIRSEKALLGLRKVKALYVNPTLTQNDWPEYSLESQLIQISERLDKEGESARVSDLVYIWLRQDSSSPWQSTIEMIQSGLAERELLDKSESTKLKVFTTINYSLPESTAALAKQYPINPVKELLTNCENNQKELWELLKKENKRAIKQRTEQDDMDFD